MACHSVISKIKESKIQYYQHYFWKYSTNVKKAWDGINIKQNYNQK